MTGTEFRRQLVPFSRSIAARHSRGWRGGGGGQCGEGQARADPTDSGMSSCPPPSTRPSATWTAQALRSTVA